MKEISWIMDIGYDNGMEGDKLDNGYDNGMEGDKLDKIQITDISNICILLGGKKEAKER